MIQESRDLLSRRSLLLAGLAASGAVAGRRLLGQATTPDAGAHDLVIRNARALDAEAPISSLRRTRRRTTSSSCAVTSVCRPNFLSTGG